MKSLFNEILRVSSYKTDFKKYKRYKLYVNI